jgi:cell division protein FtsI/penicillin-binding protein 2
MQRGLKTRIGLAALGLVGAFTFVSTHLVGIQVVEHEEWRGRAEGDYARRKVLQAKRGYLFDRNGEQLAHNLPVFDLVADRLRLEDFNSVVGGLAAAAGDDPAAVRELARALRRRGPAALPELLPRYFDRVAGILANHIAGGREGIRAQFEFGSRKRAVLARDLTPQMTQEIGAALDSGGISGLYFEAAAKRFYPGRSTGCHLLGFVDHEGVGREGLEATMNRWLAGEPGFRETMVDRRGRELPSYSGREQAPRDGANVHLTIDSALQALVEEELAAGEAAFGTQRVCAVLIDPSTGDILALASRPFFDPNTREGSRRNFAFSDVYEPGSTFKIVAVAAALDLGLVNLDTRIFCENGKLVEGRLTVPDHKPFGWLTVSEIIAKSSNIGTFKLARQAGMDRFYDYVGRFGFGQRTGLPLTSENAGQFARSRNPSDFSRCSFGYALSVTPVQLAGAYATIANHGRRMKPRLVTRVTAPDGRVLWENPPESRGQVVAPRTAAQVLRAMRTVVEEKGTGQLGAVEGYQVAGKTGTATRFDAARRRYLEGKYHCSFGGIVPADEPRLVCVVVAEDPSPPEGVAISGGAIAAPIFAKIAGRALAHLQVPPADSPAAAPAGPRAASR